MIRPDITLIIISALLIIVLIQSFSKKKQPGISAQSVFLIGAILVSMSATAFYILQTNETLEEFRNTQRSNDVYELVNAIQKFYSSNNFPEDQFITVSNCPARKEIGEGVNKINLEELLVDEYINYIPWDPLFGSTEATRYYMCRDEDRFVVSAPKAENERQIEMSL